MRYLVVEKKKYVEENIIFSFSSVKNWNTFCDRIEMMCIFMRVPKKYYQKKL